MINYRLKAKIRSYEKTVITFTRDDNAIDVASFNRIFLC